MKPQLTYLVTGGAGFLGSHLCRRLLVGSNKVIAWDDLSTGCIRNVEALHANPNFELIRHDVAQAKRIPDTVTHIFNLACPASPVHYGRDPIKTLKTSVWGAMHLLEEASRLNARILQASTSEVYGDPLLHPQSESYLGNVNAFGPRACYDEGKRAAETLFYDFHHTRGVDTRIARIFNTYGPYMAPDDGRVVSNFIVQALAENPLTLFGAGTQTRSFCFVEDLVSGLVALMHDDDVGPSPTNLGNPAEMTMLALAHEVLRQTDSRSQLAFLPLPVDDPKQRCPDITRATTALGWRPSVALPEGLRQTIAYFKTLMP